MKTSKKVLTYVIIMLIAAAAALIYQIFVFPNNFAPAGLNGICTIIQYVFGLRVGYLSLLLNLPLALLVFFKVSKPLAVRSMVYVLTFSVALLVLDHVDLSRFAYETENGTSAILGPLVGGISFGYCYGQLLNCSAYSGGTDFVAALIHRKRPEQSVLGLIFVLNAAVAISSYFVYDYKIEPVILSILYSFASTTVSRQMLQSGRSAVRFEIITEYPQQIGDAIIHQLHHSATLIPGKGMYKGKPTSILICIINKTQTAALTSIIRSYPNTFAVMSHVNEVMGNFKHLTNDGKEEIQLLDHGDQMPV